MMAHRDIDSYRRAAERERAVMQIPCRECGVELWNHVERLAGHKFVSGMAPQEPERSES
jgi:hypothetical protein